MTGPTNYFILIYDMTSRHVDVHEFGPDLEKANECYSAYEDKFAANKYEVVLVGADSIETIKRTHSPYFSTGTTRQIVDEFIASIK